MEIKAKLLKPYTEAEKNKFIAKQNLARYKVEYTEEGLEAWGPTAEEIAEAEKEAKRQEILKQLDSLDLKSIRAIRANDEEYIAQYEAQAQELRRQLQEL
jgi:hypothetical protein